MTRLGHIDTAQLREVARRIARGLQAFGVPMPQSLDEWAREHFYLSRESSYVEQRWTPWPFQRAIMACISNDDIAEVDLKKSARVGYTKIILAAIGYYAHHKRRNQAIWQPTDGDADDFVKSELDPMLRDVEAMHAVFPAHMARHKDNTLTQKKFLGSLLRILGAKAAKNFRRISIDVGYLDELDAMDRDVESEGDPRTLAAKRLEGATFPKLVCGSTPKEAGFSLIDERHAEADHRFTYQIPCPHCAELHAITWGGKDEPHGLKWIDRNPDTVAHLCPHCACTITQPQFLAVADAGVYVNEDRTIHLHADARFTDPQGAPVPTPRHVGLHVWTAYSPVVAWPQIVREFLAAIEAKEKGDDTKIKAFRNTTLGLTWDGDIQRTEADEFKQRGEPYALRRMPRDCLLLLGGVDTQDNRLELGVWGYGRGGRMWAVDHVVFHGNPALPDVWAELEAHLRSAEYEHACGIPQRIHATAVDSGGHHADAVYAFAHRLRGLRVHAIKGHNGRERSIDHSNTRVTFNWRGKVERHGPVLWIVGTNLAKDRFQSRLAVTTPGPGYVHLSSECSDEWFAQLASEVRALRRTATGTESRWTPVRKRNEVKDCLTYCIWLEERLDLWGPRRAKWWDQLEATVQPAGDLFTTPNEPTPAAPASTPPRNPADATPPRPQAAAAAQPRPAARRSNFATRW